MMIKKSPWISICNTGGCNGCAIECLPLITPKYDVERFGIVLKPSARHADILLVTGPTTEKTKGPLRRIYDQMSKDKKVTEGRITLVLVRGIGDAFLTADVEHEALNTYLGSMLA